MSPETIRLYLIEMLGNAPRYSMLRVGNWLMGMFGRVFGRERDQYEMFSVDSKRSHAE